METNLQTVISQAVQQSNEFTIGIWYLIGAALVFLCSAVSQWLKQVLQERKMPVTL